MQPGQRIHFEEIRSARMSPGGRPRGLHRGSEALVHTRRANSIASTATASSAQPVADQPFIVTLVGCRSRFPAPPSAPAGFPSRRVRAPPDPCRDPYGEFPARQKTLDQDRLSEPVREVRGRRTNSSPMPDFRGAEKYPCWILPLPAWRIPGTAVGIPPDPHPFQSPQRRSLQPHVADDGLAIALCNVRPSTADRKRYTRSVGIEKRRNL